ncbi:conserved hypothetical protein [Candidatus Zixiibacteriota bacterium]|nr:conserved hypothetical protein [candidate division Zixibacteria bacterium]
MINDPNPASLQESPAGVRPKPILRLLLLMAAALLLGLIYSCGKSNKPTAPSQGNNGGGGGNFGGDTISIPARMAALDSVQNKFESLGSFSHDSIAKALLAYIKSRPEFEDAGITNGTTVWGRFKDGRVLIIPNNRDPSYPPDSGTVDTLSTAAMIPGGSNRAGGYQKNYILRKPGAVAAGTAVEIPDNADAFLLRSMGNTCYFNPVPTLKALLGKQHYTILSNGEYSSNGTIANLKAVQNAGIFYFDGHGGEGKLRDSSVLYGLWTADFANDAGEVTYDAMLSAGELCYMIERTVINGTVPACGDLKHYGITPAFVKKYMTFGNNSLVYIDACDSDEPNFQQAFKGKGASMYLGWSGGVSDGFAVGLAYYIFDRLLGTNLISPRENPPQRAFDINSIIDELESRGKTLDPISGANLVKVPLRDHFGILAPSIEFLSITEEETKSYLTLAGIFGSDRGATERNVTLNGQPLNVRYWTQDSILCDLDVSGPQSSGTVQAEVKPQGELVGPDQLQKSNKINISEWNGEIHYSKSGPDSLLADIYMGIHFRGDVHPFREKPHQNPYVTEYLFQNGLADSGGYAKFSGAHTFPPSGSCTMSLVLSDSFNIGNAWQYTQLGSFTYNGAIDMIHDQLQLNLSFTAGDSVGHLVYGGGNGCPSGQYEFDTQIGGDTCIYDEFTTDYQDFLMPIDPATYNVVKGQRQCQASSMYYLYMFDDMKATAKIEWDTLKVKYPPLPNEGH